MTKTLYEILEIPEGATATVIKDAYRRLAMKWHPDRNPDNWNEATERFKQIGYAYKVLSDPTERANYDDSLREQRQHESSQSAETEHEGYEDFSGASAQQMFFEQMLDLAVELAARGFGQDQIIKTLQSLDCPEGIARAAAVNAVKTAGQKTAGTPHRAGSQRPQVTSIEQLGWREAEPFYFAVIDGAHAAERMSDGDYMGKMSIFKTQTKWLLISFLSFIFGSIGVAVVTPIVTSAPERFDLLFAILLALGALGLLGIVGVLVWRFATDSTVFRRERSIRYYLTAFECFHNAKPLPTRSYAFHAPAFIFTLAWLAYRRMPGHALLATVAFVVIGSIVMFININASVFHLMLNFYGYAIGAVLGVFANKVYFNSTRKRIQQFITLPQDRALAKLREVGGINSWSWLGFASLFFVLLMPAAAIVGDIEQERAAAVEVQQQSEVGIQQQPEATAQQQAVAEAPAKEWGEPPLQVKPDAEAMELKSLDLVIAEMEARHPELNKNHPRYDQALVDDALARMETYVKQGNTRSSALRLAVADMEREADTARPVQQ